GMVSAALNFGASSPIIVQVEGGTTGKAMELAQDIQQRIKTVRGAADVRILQRNNARQYVIEVDRIKAADVGLSEYEVLAQVTTAMNSSVSLSRNFWIDSKSGNQYLVGVQYSENPKLKLRDIENISATGAKAKYPVKLGDLVKFKKRNAAVEVNHVS